MSDWYKMEPSAWDFGTADMTLEEEAAYLRIVNAINKHDAPVPNNDRVLAGMFRSSTRKAKALLSRLVEMGKVYIEQDAIWNERARFEVGSRSVRSELNAENGAKGGRISAERRSKALKNQETVQAVASSRIEEKRIETEPNGSDAKASPVPVGEDARKALFSEALPVLARYTGKPDSALRPLIGKWLKKSGDDARRLVVLIAQSVEERRAEPIAWIEGCLKQSGHAKGKFVIKANGSVHKQDEHTGEWWECHGIEAHQVESIAVRDLRNLEAA